MNTTHLLTPAAELVKLSEAHFPNENNEYRQARNALLAEEIELRRHIERVAEQRRALPPGGEVSRNYRFEGEHGPVSFADRPACRLQEGTRLARPQALLGHERRLYSRLCKRRGRR